MMRVLAILAAALLAACASPTIERLESDEFDQCTEDRSIQLTISALTQASAKYHQACVTVSGIATRDRLYRMSTLSQSLADAYRTGESPYFKQPDTASITLLGGSETALFHNRPISVTGVILDCGLENLAYDMAAAVETAILRLTDPGDEYLWFSSGLCGRSNSAFLYVSSMRVRDGEVPVRLLPRDQTPMIGSLVPATPDWQHFARVRDHARAFLAALRSSDPSALAAIRPHTISEIGLISEVTDYARIFRVPYLAYDTLRRSAHGEQIMIAPHTRYDEDGIKQPRDDEVAATVCFCTRADCTHLWPISIFDADNRPERPYVCFLAANDSSELDAIVMWSYLTPEAGSGVLEPEETAPP